MAPKDTRFVEIRLMLQHEVRIVWAMLHHLAKSTLSLPCVACPLLPHACYLPGLLGWKKEALHQEIPDHKLPLQKLRPLMQAA